MFQPTLKPEDKLQRAVKMESFHSTAILIVLVCILRGTLASQVSNRLCPEHCQCKMKKVECVNLSESWVDFLEGIPHDTEALTIRDSRLEGMTLSDFESIPTYRQMNYLRITNCNITVIGPKAFRVFPDLIELHLDSDFIQELDGDGLHSLSSLKLLDLKKNVISHLHENTFQATRDLQVLDLAYNQIEVLYPTIFQATEGLQKLNFTKNKVSFLHPDTFKNLTQLHTVSLDHNQLEVLHQDTFENLTSLRHVSVDNNPWSCDCGLLWLQAGSNETHPLLRSLKSGLQCRSPPEFESQYLHNITFNNLTCINPKITNKLEDIAFLRLDTKVLRCNVTGNPVPSVYWLTPRGVLAVPNNRKWMSPKITHFQQSHEFIGVPTFHRSNLVALEDGSLMIHQIRHYFAGRYTCVAENPAGVSFSSFNVSIVSAIPLNVHFSMGIGGITSACFFVLCMIFASIRQSVFCALKKKYKKAVIGIEDAEEARTDSQASSHGWSPNYWAGEYISPYESPMKCTTPNEPVTEDENREGRAKIRETLEDARFRLRLGMERSVTKIRSGAQHVTESGRQYMHTIRSSSSHYMQTIKESGSTTIHNLRSSGSQAANRMRAGVVLGVEQVKYHVQSMRELCLTGNIGQTISTVSVATNVDSQETTDIVKKVTYV